MPEFDLSSDTREIVDALLACRAPEIDAPVDSDLLTRFAAGLVSAEEHDLVVDLMTRSDEMRRSVLTLRRDLARQSDASVIRGLVTRAVGKYQALSGRIADLSDPFALSALRAAGRRIAADLSGPRWATVRSGVGESVEPWVLRVRPQGLEATVVAELSNGGDLEMSVRVTGVVEDLDLCLKDPVFGFIGLGRSAGQDGVYSFNVPQFAEMAGIERIEPSHFALSIAGLEGSGDSGSLLVDVPTGDPVWAPIASGPEVSGGILRMSVGLPEGTRQQMSGNKLELQLLVGSLAVTLTSTPVADLDGDEVRFEAEVGQVPDGVIGSGSVFRLRFT